MAVFVSIPPFPFFPAISPKTSPSSISGTLAPLKPIQKALAVPAPAPRCHWSNPVLQTRRHCCCASSGSSSTEERPSPSHRIFIKGFPSSTSEGFLVKTFSRFGEVTRVKIITTKTSKQSLGLAYIWFACEEDAQFAAKEINGKFFDGRFVFVTIARPESSTSQVRAIPYQF